MRELASNEMEHVFYTHDGRPADKWHHYLEIYDRHLSRYRGRRVRLLEIGVQRGGSLQVWKKYLGSDAIIAGVDVDPKCAYTEPQISAVTGDQKNRLLLTAIASSTSGPLDVVVDDGSHASFDQIASFETLYPLLAPDGVYICEDMHSAYDGQDYHFVARVKDLVDRMHAWYVDGADLSYARTTYAVHFYDSVIVIEKRPRERPFRAVVGRTDGL